MHIYLKKNPAKFHPDDSDPFWNDGALVFFEKQENNNFSNKFVAQKRWNGALDLTSPH